MQRTITVHFLPDFVEVHQFSDKAVVVIDVLRATTTIAYALAAKAACVLPCLEIEDARRIKAEIGGEAILGGERGGVRIDGFDLGNSPADYTPAVVAGQTVIFTTTNGTRAMQRASAAHRILIASFVNLSAVAERLSQEDQIELLCAGTDGQVTREDVLLAGAVTDRLLTTDPDTVINDEASLAAAAWRQLQSEGDALRQALLEALCNSLGGRNLIELGLEADVELAAQIDRFDLVPELDVSKWQIAAN